MVERNETFLVHAMRSIVTGHGRCPTIQHALSGIVGADAVDLVRTLAILLGALDNGCRRTITIGYRGHTALTLDEVQILAILACAQHDAGEEMAARLSWLVEAPHQKPVAIAARIVGRLLQANGIMLRPFRHEQMPALSSVA